MVEEKLKAHIQEALAQAQFECPDFRIEHPKDLAHGDYAVAVPLILAKKLNGNPKQIAETITTELLKNPLPEIEKIEIAPSGFINFRLSRKFLADSVAQILNEREMYGYNNHVKGYRVMVEYTSPNLFKPLHIGNLVSNVIGESLSRLIDASGAEVKRTNYPSDIGLTVAKGVWGLEKTGGDPHDITALGEAYRIGNTAYEDDPQGKSEIEAINKAIYRGNDERVNELRKIGIETSLKHLKVLCQKLGTTFDFEFFESETAPVGEKIVRSHLNDGIFHESEGAIIFKGEDVGLHTRVFINSLGLPTYETKDIGNIELKREAYPFDLSIVVTSTEQKEYFKVIIAVAKQIFPELVGKLSHISHGFLTLPSGKMSSRKGNVITGESLLYDLEETVKEKIKERNYEGSEAEKIPEQVAVAAVKYAILKQAVGTDIVFDIEKSLSFEGDSGPYLQYSYVRTRSVLRKALESGEKVSASNPSSQMYEIERMLYRFPEVVYRASAEYAPHYVVTYLTELSSMFNAFYANTKILGEGEKTAYLLALTEATGIVLKNGLKVLGIPTPEAM